MVTEEIGRAGSMTSSEASAKWIHKISLEAGLQ